MSYLHTALKGTSWLLLFHALSSIAAYVTRIFLARSLRPEEYGLFYAVFSVVTFFLFFRDLGIAPSLSRYIPEFKIQQKFNEIKTAIVTVVLFQIIGSLVGIIILFVLADYLAVVYFKDPNASIMLKILLFYVFFSLFFRITRAIFHGFQSMFLFATGEFARAAVTLILMVLFVWLGYGILSPALAYALLNPILMLVYMPFLIKEFNFFKHKIVNFKEITKKIVIYSIPLFVTQIASKFISDVDTFILTLFRTTKEIGIYHVVLPTSQLLLFFGTSVSLALFPISAELFAKNDRKRLIDGVQLAYRYMFVLIIPVLIVMFVFSDIFVGTVFGQEYSAGSTALKILLVGVLFFTGATINNSIIGSIGDPKLITKITVFSMLFNTILDFIFVPRFGINAAATTTSISYFLALLWSTYHATKILETTAPYGKWLLTIIPAIAGGVTTTLVRYSVSLLPILEIVAAGIAGVGVYLVLLVVLRVVDIQEIKNYIRILRHERT